MKRLLSLFLTIIVVGINTTKVQCAICDTINNKRNIKFPYIAHGIDSLGNNGDIFNVRNTHILNLSTQPLILSVGIPNIEADLQLSEKFSISLNLGYAPWFISSRFAPRCLFILPETRYWIKSCGGGFFVGVHLNTAWYNLKLGNYRYQDTDFPALGGGITLGYQYRFSESFSLRFDLGAGYTYLKYDRYHNTVQGEKIDIRKTSYFGVDRFSIALAYSIPL